MAEHDDHDPTAALDDSRMPFLDHLRELRSRLRNAVIALIGGFAVAFAFKEDLFVLMARPLLEVSAELKETNPAIGEHSFYFMSLLEPFWAYFALSLYAGIFVASPFIFHQIWKFIAPGLYARERIYGMTFAVISAIFFIGGAVFCYILVLPAVTEFLLSYSAQNVADLAKVTGAQGLEMPLQPLLSMQDYLGYARKLLLGFGLVFELPLLIFFLSLAGVVTHRGLWKFNRWWMVLSFLIAAALTPPDVISQAMMAGPLIVLYNLSILIALVITKRRERKERAGVP
jgi:sec-independent protein translocase protein TatC